MKTFYFPGCGFGFWCALAKLFIILDTEKNYKLYGSSCGSLICLISLIKKKYQNFDTIFKISNQIKKKLSFPLNLYQLSEYFIDEFIKLIDDEPKLDNIYIQITTISNKYPFIHKKIKTPESLEDLKKLCLASTYIPILSRKYPYFCTYYNDEIAIDGYISELLLTYSDKYDYTFDGPGALFMPDDNTCKLMFINSILKYNNYDLKNMVKYIL